MAPLFCLLEAVITARQINQLVLEFNRRGNLTMSAMKAGVTCKTARKYLDQADPLDSPRAEHTWRTRVDEFAEIWPQAEAMLALTPELEAKSLFEFFGERYPGRFKRMRPANCIYR